MKVMTVVGTRPELIRLSRVIRRLDGDTEHVLVHTGQNWDPQLSTVFFTELEIRPPDYWLDVPVTSLGSVLGGILMAIEPILKQERPDAFLVLGDTNSCISAIMAKRLGIPVFHMEAGNRCFDESVPEETNRRIIDHTADFNLCYTEHARRNLLAEGRPTQRIFVTGSPMGEVLAAYDDRINASAILATLGLETGGYFLVSMHRQENIDDPESLHILLDTVSALAAGSGMRVIVSTHPRLRKRLAERGTINGSVEFLDPFGYFDYNKLQRQARCVLSDSGTISEEAAISGFPAVTIRNAIERPEALDSGSIILTGVDAVSIARCVQLAITQWDAGDRPRIPVEYEVLDCALRVSRLIFSLTAVHTKWLHLPPRPQESTLLS